MSANVGPTGSGLGVLTAAGLFNGAGESRRRRIVFCRALAGQCLRPTFACHLAGVRSTFGACSLAVQAGIFAAQRRPILGSRLEPFAPHWGGTWLNRPMCRYPMGRYAVPFLCAGAPFAHLLGSAIDTA